MEISGANAEKALESAGIVANRNVVPGDADEPGKVSGLRLRTCAIAYRGMGPAEVGRIAGLMDQILRNPDSEHIRNQVRNAVQALCRQFPVYAQEIVGQVNRLNQPMI